MATIQKFIDVHVCDLCSKEGVVSLCVHCSKEVCDECGWNIKCGPLEFLWSAHGVVCGACKSYLMRLLEAFGFHFGRVDTGAFIVETSPEPHWKLHGTEKPKQV